MLSSPPPSAQCGRDPGSSATFEQELASGIPLKASFFITYIMIDGWASIAAEVLMLKPLIVYHLKNFFLVKTEKDREEAMDPGSIGFNTGEPRIQLYFCKCSGLCKI